MNLSKLHNAIAAVCPINGISIGNATDKSTWTFNATEVATDDEKTAAQDVIDAADLSILNDVIYVPCKVVIERLSALGKYEIVKGAMSEVQKDIFFSLKEGIATDDAGVIALLTACGVDYTQVLY